jgi:hypothetical protein
LADHQRASGGRSVKVPIALADYAEGVNRSLAGPENRDSESTIENDWTTGVVAFSRSRGLILSELLTELSARPMQPGPPVNRRDDGMCPKHQVPDPEVDPSRFLLAEGWNAQLWHEPEPDSVGSVPPVLLDANVAHWRAEIARHIHLEAVPQGLDVVVISAARAGVIASLLRELATRLRPGLAVEPVQSDGSISSLAAELAQDMYARSWAQ